MSRKKISPDNQNNNRTGKTKTARRGKRRGVSMPVRYRLLMFACAACLLVGFFFAARQHFSSIDFSIKNSRLRKMSEELEADKRRLLLTKEIALSPTEIKKAAQKIGFKMMNATGVEVPRPAPVKTDKPRVEKSEAPKTKPAVADKKTAEPAAAEKTPVKKASETKPAEPKIKRETAQPAR